MGSYNLTTDFRGLPLWLTRLSQDDLSTSSLVMHFQPHFSKLVPHTQEEKKFEGFFLHRDCFTFTD